MSRVKIAFFCLYLALLPVVLYLLYNLFENEGLKFCFTAVFTIVSSTLVVVLLNSHLRPYLKQKAQKEAERELLFLVRMPDDATYRVTESTLYFEDGRKRVTYRRDECKWLNTSERKRTVQFHGNIQEYDKDGNHITTKIFMS